MNAGYLNDPAATAAADGTTTIWFGPTQPEGVARGNWIQTVPGKGWFTILRLYSPLPSFFEKTWLFEVGIVVLRVMILVITPPRVSIPRESGITSSKSTSFTSPWSTPAFIRRLLLLDIQPDAPEIWMHPESFHHAQFCFLSPQLLWKALKNACYTPGISFFQ